MADHSLAIDVNGLNKHFRLPRHRVHTLKERAVHPLRRTVFDDFHVLRDLSFQVGHGEFFGIVGRNGSGKSTLLKCLGGIYRADSGSIRIAGRLSPFIELGVGFNPDLTARDNVLINAVMMGLSQRQARSRFEEIIAFAELERFVDQKLKNYSSGMQVRLAFSVMVQSDPDVMLIDEVLAVGDAAFQQKCIDVFHRLREEGKTIVLVTHEMGTVERFCHRAMMLSGGDIVAIGDPAEIGRTYLRENFSGTAHHEYEGEHASRISLVSMWVTDERAVVVDAVPFGQSMRVHAAFDALTDIEQPAIAIWLTDEKGNRIFSVGAREDTVALGDFSAGERVEFTAKVPNVLSAGRYYIGCSVTRGRAGLETLLFQERAADMISYGQELHGLVHVENEQTVTRAPAPTSTPAVLR